MIDMEAGQLAVTMDAPPLLSEEEYALGLVRGSKNIFAIKRDVPILLSNEGYVVDMEASQLAVTRDAPPLLRMEGSAEGMMQRSKNTGHKGSRGMCHLSPGMRGV